jgi:hypothetical protein
MKDKPISNELAYRLTQTGLILNPPPIREYEDPRMADWVIKQNELAQEIEHHNELLKEICGVDK